MPVELAVRDGIATLTLARPERGNALGPELIEAIGARFEEALTAGARLIVLRGAGRHFCTGLDLSDLEEVSEGDLALRVIRIELLLQAIHASPVTTLAIGQGRVFGAGADLFAVCDHRLALPDARFAFPGPAFGLVLGTGRLAGLVGEGRARALLLRGEAIGPEEAVALGLATAMPAAVEDAVAAAQRDAARLDAATVAMLHRRTRRADDAADLVALVHSLARPGLKARVQAYRARVLAQRPKPG
jgi:enoyl-CoA hydratase/carnithine racemase